MADPLDPLVIKFVFPNDRWPEVRVQMVAIPPVGMELYFGKPSSPYWVDRVVARVEDWGGIEVVSVYLRDRK